MSPPQLPLLRSHETYDRALHPVEPTACSAQAPLRPGQMLAVRYACGPYELSVPGLAAMRLSINLSSAATFGGLDGERPRLHQAQRHSLFLTPANAAARWRKDVATEHINLYFHPDGLDCEDWGVTQLLAGDTALLNVSLPGSTGLIRSLDEELRAADEFSAEAADSLGRLLLIAVARGHRRVSRTRPETLPTECMRRLTAHVDGHLCARLLVADLAAVVGLPPTLFASSFLRRTGRTPHQFVLARRLARATDLLRAGRQSIAEVALASGFSSQSHLTRVMQQRLGLAPGRWLASQALPRAAGSDRD